MPGTAPPDPAVTYVTEAVAKIYAAALLVPNAPANVAALNGAIESLQGLLTDWYVNGVK